MAGDPEAPEPLELITRSEGQTEALGRALAAVMRPGDLLRLEGPLGTGKTVLVRGVARGLGYDGSVTSPTFTIIHLYPEISLCHVDAYRLAGADDLVEAGVEEYLDGEWACAVEWADRVAEALPRGGLTVSFAFGERDDDRAVTISGDGGWIRRLAGRMDGRRGDD